VGSCFAQQDSVAVAYVVDQAAAGSTGKRHFGSVGGSIFCVVENRSIIDRSEIRKQKKVRFFASVVLTTKSLQ
jgi:hypothetical protein